jgi:hypothetical protein
MDAGHRALGFRFRVFVSLLLALAFAGITISGSILYIAPAGRLAARQDWCVWSLSRDQWIALHLSISVVFAVAAIVHLWLNRKPLFAYLRIKTNTVGGLRWEGLAVLCVITLIVWGTLAPVEPFTSLLTWRQRFYREIASDHVLTEPAGMGQLTLDAYCRQLGLDVNTAIERLEQSGIDADKHETLRTIADKNKIHPSRVRSLLDTVHP